LPSIAAPSPLRVKPSVLISPSPSIFIFLSPSLVPLPLGGCVKVTVSGVIEQPLPFRPVLVLPAVVELRGGLIES
jgi:hypothetical protein